LVDESQRNQIEPSGALPATHLRPRLLGKLTAHQVGDGSIAKLTFAETITPFPRTGPNWPGGACPQ